MQLAGLSYDWNVYGVPAIHGTGVGCCIPKIRILLATVSAQPEFLEA